MRAYAGGGHQAGDIMHIFWLILVGLLGGVFGGMGMGGGTLLIPALTIFLKVSQHSAQAINLVSFLPMAIICLIIHAKNGYLKISKIWHITLIAVATSVLGAFLSSLISGRILKIILGAVLIFLAIMQFVILFIIKPDKK